MNRDRIDSTQPAWRLLLQALCRRLRGTWPERTLHTAVLPILLALSALVQVASCGGGGVGEGGTGYTVGPITGFGSVIVNGIVFDDANAGIEDGDGAMRTRAELRLGMTVEVDSDGIRSGNARAARVRFDSAITGPVERLESDGFVVLGQRVVVDSTTVLDAAAAVAPGQVVEVFALFDAGIQRYRATRVERRLVALRYRLRGVVADLDESTRTFRIGSALFAYGSASSVPSDLGVGSFVRVIVSTSTGLAGRWPVQRFVESQRLLADVDTISLKGHITSFATLANLRVDGRPVDASAAAISGGPLAIGQRVEANGAPRAGALVATSVVVRSDEDERQRGFELRGEIESLAADRTSLVLRGVTVGLVGATYDGGSATTLAVGRQIEVRAVVTAGNGARLDALTVKFR